MANLNLGQDVANKREKIDIVADIMVNSYTYSKLQEGVVTVLLLTPTPLLEV